MLQNYPVSQRFVLNDRRLLDVMHDWTVDLEGRADEAISIPVAVHLPTGFTYSPRELLSRRKRFHAGWRAGFRVCESGLNQVVCSLRSTFERVDAGWQSIRSVLRTGSCLLVGDRSSTAEVVHKRTAACLPFWYTESRSSGVRQTAVRRGDRCAFDALADSEWRCRDQPLSNLLRAGDCAARDVHVLTVLPHRTGQEGAACATEEIRTSSHALNLPPVRGSPPRGTVINMALPVQHGTDFDRPPELIEPASAVLCKTIEVDNATATAPRGQ